LTLLPEAREVNVSRKRAATALSPTDQRRQSRTASSFTTEQARHEFGPFADAFALDQRFTAAHAHRVVGWSPAACDVLAELTTNG
jgi:hypothetical protein